MVGLGEEDQELVSTLPSDYVGLANHSAETSGDLT
jgi:hypothetical protein